MKMTKKTTNMTSQKNPMKTNNKDKDKSTVTNDKLYEGLICLDVKLSKLLEVIDKIYAIAEQKQTGGNNTLKTTSKK